MCAKVHLHLCFWRYLLLIGQAGGVLSYDSCFFELLGLATWGILNQPLTGGDEEAWKMIQQEQNIYGYKGKMTSGKQENASYF